MNRPMARVLGSLRAVAVRLTATTVRISDSKRYTS
jgi:hypothetical protein